ARCSRVLPMPRVGRAIPPPPISWPMRTCGARILKRARQCSSRSPRNTRLQANPGNTEILARIGDIYADRDRFAEAAPYWERIPRVAPGESGGYLEAATIYWDYYDFDNSLRLLNPGRARLLNPSLYAYEAGAIYESKREYPHAIEEYVKGALAASSDSPAEL